MKRILALPLTALLIVMPLTNVAFATGTPDACVDIQKQVSVDGGSTWTESDTEADAAVTLLGAAYRLIVTNCGDAKITNLNIEDPLLGVQTYIEKLRPTEFTIVEVSDPELCLTYPGQYVINTSTVSADGFDWTGGDPTPVIVTDADDAVAYCKPEDVIGDQGCTPGYWKQEHHLDSWPAAYHPENKYSDVFGVNITIKLGGALADPTLLQALAAKGGQVNALARHSVAALLNGASDEVFYGMFTGSVINQTQAAITSGSDAEIENLKNMLDELNNSGCPLN